MLLNTRGAKLARKSKGPRQRKNKQEMSGFRHLRGKAATDFSPRASAQFQRTDAPPGSPEKIAVLRERVARMFPLWHPDDKADYEGKYQLTLFLGDD